MKITELKQRLLEEGCSPYNFSIGPGGLDVFCLEQQNSVWRDALCRVFVVGKDIFKAVDFGRSPGREQLHNRLCERFGRKSVFL